MTDVKLILVSAAALIDPSGRILIAKRPPGKSLGGLWEFPGGKIEPGENPEVALVRELQEELDILVLTEDLQPFAFASHAYESFHLLMPLFLCRTWQGTPRRKEHTDMAWLFPPQMKGYPLAPADIVLVDALCARR